jgi:hypothetical protein
MKKENGVISLAKLQPLHTIIGKKTWLVQSNACMSQKTLNLDTTSKKQCIEEIVS